MITAGDPTEAPLIAWGFDPIYFAGDRPTAPDLDTVGNGRRPIVIAHANGHLMTVNSAMSSAAGINADTEVEGVMKHAAGPLAGQPNGELQEPAAMYLVLARWPRPDHRHTLQHGQMIDRAMFHRMATLGLCAILFTNHLWYWGDQHHDITMGPDRAHRLNACRSALDAGVALAIHSDAPITPLAPLFTAWCAVNRITPSGRVLGAAEALTVAESLRAITLGAAWTLKLDAEIGSIECGKRADFAVLHDDLLDLPAAALKDARVWGTVLSGRVFEAGA